MAILLVSHDLAVIAGHCDRVIVMYAGAIMESGPVEAVLRRAEEPLHAGASSRRVRGPARRAARGSEHHTRRSRPLTHERHNVGCPFAGRCALTIDVCRSRTPPEVAFG